jgi:6-phosphogluconolactonase
MTEFIVSYKIIVTENVKGLSEKFAQILSEILRAKKSPINVALSGGSTPKSIFDLLAENYKDKIDWAKINFFWGDERCVPSDHPDSNYFMTYEHLFSKINVPPKNIFKIDGDNKPEDEAIRYAEEILKNVDLINNIPSFDLVTLGLGEDGHTASIFPDSINLISDKRICAVSQHPALYQKRITLTGTVINNSKKIIFLVTGKSKNEMVDKIINKKSDFEKLPASFINPTDGELIWLMDKEAANLI